MNITLYQNNSEMAKINKSLTQIASYTGTLRNSTDILKPVIIIDSTDDIILSANYAYIPDLGRYYFITGVEVINNNLYQVSMRVDVLQTYATQILQQRAIIKRQENQYNLYLNDPMYKTYQNPMIITKKFPVDLTARNLILVVAGGWQWETTT